MQLRSNKQGCYITAQRWHRVFYCEDFFFIRLKVFWSCVELILVFSVVDAERFVCNSTSLKKLVLGDTVNANKMSATLCADRAALSKLLDQMRQNLDAARLSQLVSQQSMLSFIYSLYAILLFVLILKMVCVITAQFKSLLLCLYCAIAWLCFSTNNIDINCFYQFYINWSYLLQIEISNSKCQQDFTL